MHTWATIDPDVMGAQCGGIGIVRVSLVLTETPIHFHAYTVGFSDVLITVTTRAHTVAFTFLLFEYHYYLLQLHYYFFYISN